MRVRCISLISVYAGPLRSRVTDPANFSLVGLPPFDILEDLAAALRAAGLDVDQVFENAVKASGEFIYDPCRSGGLKQRFAQKYQKDRMVPITWKSLEATLNPMPLAFSVIKRVLDWIDRCDEASKQGLPAPPFRAADGPIFPDEESEDALWWCTDIKRKQKADEKGDEDGPPESSDSEEGQDEGEKKPDDALTSDSDPDSSRSERGESQSQTVVLPVRHDRRPPDPNCAWASART